MNNTNINTNSAFSLFSKYNLLHILFCSLLFLIRYFWEILIHRNSKEKPLFFFFLAAECVYVCVLDTQSCPTLCNPMDCSPPGSSVHGIVQARIPEWGAISSFGGSSQPRGQNCVTCVSCVGRQVLSHCATWEAAECIPSSSHTILCLAGFLSVAFPIF